MRIRGRGLGFRRRQRRNDRRIEQMPQVEASPRSVDFEDALPRYENGKLYIKRLRDRYWKDRAGKI